MWSDQWLHCINKMLDLGAELPLFVPRFEPFYTYYTIDSMRRFVDCSDLAEGSSKSYLPLRLERG